MKVLFNKELIDNDHLFISIENRAFQYGDGLFETIIVGKGHVDLLDYHYSRLRKGTQTLSIELPGYFTNPYLKKSISKLVDLNEINGPVRIKLQVWRSSGGRYEPVSNSSNILITASPHNPEKRMLNNVGIARAIMNYPSPFSQFKTISALKYVLGSIEKQKTGNDDLIILDQMGNISELLYSNIFWIKDGVFYTPSLLTGCVKGVMRSYLIDKLKIKKINFYEIETSPDSLRDADYIFATNAAGITPIVKLFGQKFNVYSDLDQIIELRN
jgi:branched-chain amino acid aminotransferase/4-amino-4-deoxychorismate lyase